MDGVSSRYLLHGGIRKMEEQPPCLYASQQKHPGHGVQFACHSFAQLSKSHPRWKNEEGVYDHHMTTTKRAYIHFFCRGCFGVVDTLSDPWNLTHQALAY